MIKINSKKTCWNCPYAELKGNVDFRSCGQSKEEIRNTKENTVITCAKREELGYFEPNIPFEYCPIWEYNDEYEIYMPKKAKVMILGIDGYLGWTLALKLGKLGFQVSGVDNFKRRKMVAEKGSHSITPILDIKDRLKIAKEKMGIDIKFREIDVEKENDKFEDFLKEIKPDSIIYYAEVPSAPYSMVDVDHAVDVQKNNVLGTLKVLYNVKEHIPECNIIKLGTAGEYGSPLTGRPLFEGLFPSDAILQWNNEEWSMGGELTPRNPPSFYHVSKVQDTFNIYEACKYWWLRSVDIMQGVIYGLYTDELAKHPELCTRFDNDEWFGTVVNRFVTQAILGIPLTIYGEGNQLRGFIGLDDAMQCMIRLICSPPEPGQYEVVNQVSGIYRIRDLAETIAKIGNEEFNLDVTIQRLENPRTEADRHPIEVVSKKLERDYGLKAKIRLKDEIRRMFKILTKPEIKKRIELTKDSILPETRWDGTHKKSGVLEEYKPGTKENKIILKRKLDKVDGEGYELSSIEDDENGN